MPSRVEYLECREDGSNKFYRLTFNDNGTALRQWGPIGSAGQTKSISVQEAEKLLREKLRKGYVRARDPNGAASSSYSPPSESSRSSRDVSPRPSSRKANPPPTQEPPDELVVVGIRRLIKAPE